MSGEIKDLGLKCFNEHIKAEKELRNEKLVELRDAIAKELGDDYITSSIVNTNVYPDKEDKNLFPTIRFEIKKEENETTWKLAYRMMDLFGINTIPYVSNFGDRAEVLLDVTEYWKNLLIEGKSAGQRVHPELIDLCGELQFQQWVEWSKGISETLSDCDITMQKVIEVYDNEQDMGEVLREQWESIREVSRLLINWHNLWSKSYYDLTDEEKRIYKDYALRLMNLYINWHFANIVKV